MALARSCAGFSPMPAFEALPSHIILVAIGIISINERYTMTPAEKLIPNANSLKSLRFIKKVMPAPIAVAAPATSVIKKDVNISD